MESCETPEKVSYRWLSEEPRECHSVWPLLSGGTEAGQEAEGGCPTEACEARAVPRKGGAQRNAHGMTGLTL